MKVPDTMQAMILQNPGQPLVRSEVPVPVPGPNQVLIKVHACGVCRTDLHVADGELTEPKLPLIPGHEIVGSVVRKGTEVDTLELGLRIGVPWFGSTCGECRYCRTGRENLCDRPKFTGYSVDGGYAEYAAADTRYCFPLPEGYGDAGATSYSASGWAGSSS